WRAGSVLLIFVFHTVLIGGIVETVAHTACCFIIRKYSPRVGVRMSRFRTIPALFFLLFSMVELSAQPPASVTLVNAGRLLDPRTGNVLAPAVVLIEGNKIKQVGSPSRGGAPAG